MFYQDVDVLKIKEKNMIGKYVLVRGDRSGIFTGTLEKQEGNDGRQITLRNVRRLWYWDGAASISHIAKYGVNKPENCKFPVENEIIKILDTIEIIECTEESKKSIEKVPVWSQ